MPIQVHHEAANILRMEMRGLLRKPELEHGQQAVLAEVEKSGAVRLLFVLDKFEGWDPGDNWRDLSFYVKHGDLIERIAIVGAERWRELAMMFAAADLRKAPVAFFGEGDVEDARAWLRA